MYGNLFSSYVMVKDSSVKSAETELMSFFLLKSAVLWFVPVGSFSTSFKFHQIG